MRRIAEPSALRRTFADEVVGVVVLLMVTASPLPRTKFCSGRRRRLLFLAVPPDGSSRAFQAFGDAYGNQFFAGDEYIPLFHKVSQTQFERIDASRRAISSISDS